MNVNDAIVQFALRKMQSNPQAAQSPIGQQFINILQSGNEAAGIELANNLCQTYGDTPQQALQKARNSFHI